jgi:hypothetical protein
MRALSTVATFSAARCAGEIHPNTTRQAFGHGPIPWASAFFIPGPAISQMVAASLLPSACRNVS